MEQRPKHTLYLCDPTKNVNCNKTTCMFSQPGSSAACNATCNATLAATDNSGTPITLEKFNFDRYVKGLPLTQFINPLHPLGPELEYQLGRCLELLSAEIEYKHQARKLAVPLAFLIVAITLIAVGLYIKLFN